MAQADKFITQHIKNGIKYTFKKVVPWVPTNLALLVNNLQILQGWDDALALVSAAFK